MDGCFKVLCCVFTLIIVSKYGAGAPNGGERLADAEEKITYDGDQVLRVETVNSKQRKKIKELEDRGCKYNFSQLFAVLGTYLPIQYVHLRPSRVKQNIVNIVQ